MTMADGAPSASTKASRRPRWPRTAVAIGSLVVAGAGLLASTELHGIPALHATPQAQRAAIGASIALADDAPPPPTRSLLAMRATPRASAALTALEANKPAAAAAISAGVGQTLYVTKTGRGI